MSIEEQIQMVEDCEKRESKLTEWEIGFVDAASYALGKGIGITDRQVAKLEEIWDRVTT